MNNLIYILSDCPNDEGILRIIYFILQIIRIITIVVPIILIVSVMIDILKVVASGNDSALKDKLNQAKNRFIAAVCTFLVPSIISLTLSILGPLDLEIDKYVKCANPNDIENVIVNNAKELVEEAKSSLKQDTHDKAVVAVNKISDEKLKEQYLNELEEVQKIITKNNEKPQNRPNVDDKLVVDYPDAVVENLAAFIGSEAGWHKDGTLGQLVTGAVYINNFYKFVGGEITTKSMCDTFSYPGLYSSGYCNYSLSKLSSIGIDENGKNHLMLIAKILLAKKFTIPKDVRHEAAKVGIITNRGGKVWGKAYTGVSKYPYTYFGCTKYDIPIDDVDVYGNSVSNDFNDYQEIANEVYEKYS